MKEDHGSYRRNFCSCEKKGRKNSGFYGIQTMTSAIPVQCFIDWGNKPTGSGSLNWFVLNLRKDDDEVKNIWLSYTKTMKEEHRSYRCNFCTCGKKAGNVFPAGWTLIDHFNITWHLTMKLFPAKISEQATLQNLRHQRVTVHCYQGSTKVLSDSLRLVKRPFGLFTAVCSTGKQDLLSFSHQ